MRKTKILRLRLRVNQRAGKIPCPPGIYPATITSVTLKGETMSMNMELDSRNNKKENTMATHTVLCSFKHDLRPELGIWHNPNKKYAYLTNRDDLVTGDHVVVDSPTTGPTVVIVREVMHNTKHSAAFKYVIDKVDFSDYLERRDAEDFARREKIRLKKEADAVYREVRRLNDEALLRRAAIQESLLSNMLNSDPEYRRLTDEIDKQKATMDEILTAMRNVDSV